MFQRKSCVEETTNCTVDIATLRSSGCKQPGCEYFPVAWQNGDCRHFPFIMFKFLRIDFQRIAAGLGWAGTSASERQALLVLLVSCICLTLLDYLCDRNWVLRCLQEFVGSDAARRFRECCVARTSVGSYVYWALADIACYLILPLLTIRYLLRRPLADFGVRWQGALASWRLYLGMLAVMLPLVWLASGTSGFLRNYPFMYFAPGAALWPTLFWWELLYFAQFFALEFFFRGFMLHGLAPHCGRMSILIMTVPYCMLHFGKPMPETFAAILAGFVLGSLSLKSRSILLGALIHCSVALSMDVAALWRKGLIFN